MNAFRVLPVVTLLFLSLTVASVYADGYSQGNPSVGTTGGAPALGAAGLFSGALNLFYGDGAPVFLSTNKVTLSLCSSSCVTVQAILTQTAPGTYTYTFTPPPSLTGTVTIYIKAGTLADDNGKIFPSVDTSIGTYAAPSTSSSNVPAMAAPAGTPPSQSKQAVDMSPNVAPTSQSPLPTVVTALTVLAVAGCLLIFVPRRH